MKNMAQENVAGKFMSDATLWLAMGERGMVHSRSSGGGDSDGFCWLAMFYSDTSSSVLASG